MSANNDQLNVISWNAQSIANNSNVFELDLLLRDHNIHVACTQETYLHNKSKIHFEYYNLYRNDRLTHGGGVAIAFKRDIGHRLLNITDTATIENISVAIDINGREFMITSAYSPHHSNQFTDGQGNVDFWRPKRKTLGMN